MKTIVLTAFIYLFTSVALAMPAKGQLDDTGDMLMVWHTESNAWLSAEDYFAAEIKRLNGPTYGQTNQYPPYDEVKEWETLIDVLPDGRTCPMVFFHQRWRRLPDVLALDEKLRNFGGCRDVFKH